MLLTCGNIEKNPQGYFSFLYIFLLIPFLCSVCFLGLKGNQITATEIIKIMTKKRKGLFRLKQNLSIILLSMLYVEHYLVRGERSSVICSLASQRKRDLFSQRWSAKKKNCNKMMGVFLCRGGCPWQQLIYKHETHDPDGRQKNRLHTHVSSLWILPLPSFTVMDCKCVA